MLLRLYKLAVSPYLPSTCIYHPTCSDYTSEAIAQHGLAKGAWLGTKRLARCNPFTTGGLDPVPAVDEGAYRTSGGSGTGI